MAQLKAILDYQKVDAKLYKLERELAGSEERKEYAKFKKFLETAPEKLDSLEAKANALKAEAEGLSQKYQQLEDTLKEFEHLDELVTGGADIAFYKKKVQSILEQLKKLKSDLATLTANIKATDAEFQKMKKQVISAEKQYKDAKEKYSALKASREDEKKALETELSKLEKDVDEGLLATYKMKRKEKIFPVVGEATGAENQKRCPFCGMEPPIALQSKLKDGLIECESCHKLIFG